MAPFNHFNRDRQGGHKCSADQTPHMRKFVKWRDNRERRREHARITRQGVLQAELDAQDDAYEQVIQDLNDNWYDDEPMYSDRYDTTIDDPFYLGDF